MAAAEGPKITPEYLAGVIDHSLLHPTMTTKTVEEGLALAREYGCASCCVRPCDVPKAKKALDGSKTAVCTVIGFPHGTTTTATKVAESKEAMAAGATELDMVVNNGAAIGGEWDVVKADIAAVQAAAEEGGARVKVIFENDFHVGHEDRIAKLSQICSEVGVGWVKTSTGFGFVKQEGGGYSYKGAQLAHLRIMKEHAKGCELKAAGGVRSLEALLAVVGAGCTRVGASATKALVEEARKAVAEGKNLADMIPKGEDADGKVGGTY